MKSISLKRLLYLVLQRLWASYHRPACTTNSGFALPMALALGLSMITLGLITVVIAQDARDTAVLRQDTVASALTSDSAIAEILTQISTPQNSILLGKNYDPINPKTGKTYLGTDGIPNSGDEITTSVDEWQSLQPACVTENPNLALTNSISGNADYTVLAYRYHPQTQSGHLLVEGTHGEIGSYVYVNMAINPDTSNFPGVIAEESVYWQGRSLNGNLYFDPSDSADTSLAAYADPDNASRSAYLNAIWSGSDDGYFSDEIQGDLVACDIEFTLPYAAKGSNLGVINNSQTLSGSTSGITNYQADQIDLSGTHELTVDTTAGPVHIYVNNTTSLRDNAKITNLRTDGISPNVGDLRIIQTEPESNGPVILYDTSCISNAFIYAPKVDVHLLTSGAGCSGSSNNIQGVVWAEDIENSTNSLTARFYNRFDGPDLMTSGVTGGIEVPQNILSLTDALESINFSLGYKVGGINAWTHVNL